MEGLGRVNARWVDGAMSRTPHRRVILDMDSSESPVHGEQEGASYNGHFGSMCYHIPQPAKRRLTSRRDDAAALVVVEDDLASANGSDI